MKRWLTIVCIAALMAVAVAYPAAPAPAPQVEELSLSKLPGISLYSRDENKNYRIDPYLAAATKLQAMGKDEAIKLLRAESEDFKKEHESVILLCRMLFVAKPESDSLLLKLGESQFRAPRLGQPSFVAVTNSNDWPLQPIEIVDDVPFLVVVGYSGAGRPEPAQGYLQYCEKECDWSTTKFGPKTLAEKKKALEKLYVSPRWKKPLTEDEKRDLASQL